MLKRWSRHCVVIVSCVAVGCGARASEDIESDEGALAAPADLVYTSGSRLEAWGYHVDGAGVPQYWFDRALGENCTVGATPDGGAHCLPIVYASTVYLDAACAMRGASLSEPTRPGRHAIAVSNETSRDVLVELGQQRTSGRSYSRLADGSCHGRDIAPDDYVFEAQEVALETFVAGRLEPTEPIGTHLGRQRIVMADGTIAWRIVDATRGGDCIPTWNEGENRCYPANYGPVDAFADASCSTPVATVYARESVFASSRPVATKFAATECNPEWMEVVGPALALSTRFAKYGERCVGVPLSGSNLELYRVGAPIPESAFPTVTSRRRGTGRLGLLESAGGTGAVTSRVLFDRDLGACSSARFSDGKDRCLPMNVTSASTWLFTDAACTKFAVSDDALACGRDQIAVVTKPADTGTARPFVYAGYDVGPAHAGTVYTKNSGSECHPVSSPVSVHSLTPRPDSSFEELTLERL